MTGLDDHELLAEYVRTESEAAFTTLITRYVNLVHSAARRFTGNPHHAEEITQAVFIILARKARSLRRGTVLSGWLYQTARLTAANFVKGEIRRQHREQEAYMQSTLTEPDSAAWEQVAPLLDEAMGRLGEADRNAVVLRFFENKSAQEIATALKLNEAAAHKRVNRAVDKLRKLFSKRGVTLSAAALGGTIAANSVQAAPVGFAVTISVAVMKGATVAASVTALVNGTIKTIAMTTIQKTVTTAAILVTAGAGIYEAHEASTLQTQVQALQQQQAPLTEQIQQLQRERDEAKNGLATLADAIVKVKGNSSELLKLRGEVSRLRLDASQIYDPSVQTALAWQAKKKKLQKAFDERPDQRISEMQLLTDNKWLDLVKDLKLDSEDDIRYAISFVRTSAKMLSAPIIQDALKKFIAANNGNLPDDVSQLKPFFDQPLDDAILQRYKILDKEATRSGWLEGMVLIEQVATDKWRETQFAIGPQKAGLGPPPETVHLEFPQELNSAMESYQAQNPKKVPSDFNELRPYLTTPAQQAALEKLIKALEGSK